MYDTGKLHVQTTNQHQTLSKITSTKNAKQVQIAIEKDFEVSKQAQKGQMDKLHQTFLVEEVLPRLPRRRPDSGLDFQVKVLNVFKLFPSRSVAGGI